MTINNLVNDIFDYTFNKMEVTNIVICTRVCKLWYDVIMLKSMKCERCNKIISLYDTDLYGTDVYCMMCHGRPLNAGKYEILNYKISDIKMLRTIVNLLAEGSLYISIGMDDMKFAQKNYTLARCIEIKMYPIKLDTYTHHAQRVGLHTSNTQLRRLINSDNIHTSELSVYNKSTKNKAYLKINNKQTKLSSGICKTQRYLYNCNCRLQIHMQNLECISLKSIEFNKLCMSLTKPCVDIEINNKELNFIECDVGSDLTYLSDDILSISIIALLSNDIVLHFHPSYPLVFVIVIDEIMEIKISQCRRHRYRS